VKKFLQQGTPLVTMVVFVRFLLLLALPRTALDQLGIGGRRFFALAVVSSTLVAAFLSFSDLDAGDY
jgi:hypothetical protein